MTTAYQTTGKIGEDLVAKKCICPGCKKKGTYKKLPMNFKCADIICDFCGFLSQIKTMNVTNHEVIPKTCLGAAWQVQKNRMDAGIYFPFLIEIIINLEVSKFHQRVQ